MRRAIICLSAISMLTAAAPQGRPAHAPAVRHAAAPSRPSGPPHAWLFGVWTGGLFPVLDSMAEQDCRMQPTVTFAQDQVSHASLTGTTMTERVIETVRTTPAGADFRFTPATDNAAGFGCDSPDALYVARETPNTITFPGCAAFPYPLQRCSGPG